MDILGVGIKGVSPNPEKEKVGWMPVQAGGCWVLMGDVPSQKNAVPTPLGVLGHHFYMLPPAVAQQDAPKP